jgi:hypothetical protein
MSKKIDYLNLSKYLKTPHDRQPAYIGHVNYALDSGGSDAPIAATYVYNPNNPSNVLCDLDITSGDIFLLDLTGIEPSSTSVTINPRDKDGNLVESQQLGAKQLWIKYNTQNTGNLTSLSIAAAKYPLDVEPSFSIGQDAVDCITMQPGIFTRLFCIATLGFDGAT